jgi:hypothetical protein
VVFPTIEKLPKFKEVGRLNSSKEHWNPQKWPMNDKRTLTFKFSPGVEKDTSHFLDNMLTEFKKNYDGIGQKFKGLFGKEKKVKSFTGEDISIKDRFTDAMSTLLQAKIWEYRNQMKRTGPRTAGDHLFQGFEPGVLEKAEVLL